MRIKFDFVIETLARTCAAWKAPSAHRLLHHLLCPKVENLRISWVKVTFTTISFDKSTKACQSRVMSRNSAAVIDDVSKSIIEQLQSDGRKPYAAIGKSIGLSEAAVRQRVQKLLDTNVMQVVAVTDPLQVGFKRAAMIGVNVEGDIEKVADALAKLEEVNYVVVCAGGFDILIEVVCEDDEKLLSILNKRIRAIPGVDSTEAFVYLKIRKQTYSWGTK